MSHTGSTNTDLAAAAARGERDGNMVDGAVLIAEEQVAGKGRLGRTWTAPAGSSITMSMLVLLPYVPMAARGWAGVVAGIAAVRVCRELGGVSASLKWPNDLLVTDAEGAERKCAGILGEMAGSAVVIGLGLNVSLLKAELPRPDATSLLLAGSSSLDRAELAAAVLTEIDSLLRRWEGANGDVAQIRAEYLTLCATIGAGVRVELPSGATVLGVATNIALDGSLVVRSDSGELCTFTAADVLHLRPAS
ncbi:biotin--[acetyl-CoA-carboxylase] ligase [Nakamurella antarctica]|uniref:biotin--[acetyl-CoA-carboxylase] ligase n=1 Tax=Nakamurella antarctica TaxID=1902245 RepID=UPI0019D242B4|nr:biotin--[acetyl-CoA-carboxylase] ligase [Nakamurella antarctica]